MKELKFDVVFHLAGDQVVPNYMAIRLCEAPLHVLVVTEQTRKQVEVLGNALGKDCAAQELSQLEVPATEYLEIRRRFELVEGIDGKRVGVNITGGTKPMSTAALDFCRARHYVPFYMDTARRKVHVFDGDFPQLDMPKVFGSVKEFLDLGGFAVKRPGKVAADIPEDRRVLVKLFWQNKDFARRAIGLFSEATKKEYQNQKGNPPGCYLEALKSLLGGRKRDEVAVAEQWRLVFPDNSSDWRVAAKFGAGEWFEEWTLLQFASSSRNAEFTDLRSGMVLSFANGNLNRDAQEIDLAFTDGYTLTLIECKAGRVFQEHVQKLENMRRQIGGVMGRGVVCAINYQAEDDIVVQRIMNGVISLVTGDEALRMFPRRYDQIKPKRCYQYKEDYQQ